MFSAFTLSFIALFAFSRAATFTVTVGIDETTGHQGIGFDPSSINPSVGDIIAFTFQAPDYIKTPNVTQHSATQSTFDAPCTPKPGGFDSGIQSTGSVNTNTGSMFQMTVNDTQPVWFYSAANKDCNLGMVFCVNPPTSGDETYAAFLNKAKEALIVSPSSVPTSTPASSPDSSSSVSTASPATITTNASGATATKQMATVPLVIMAAIALAGWF
ncbi:hypothetical protein BU17DRAFT_86676 [Hysterangium stoloniferum]|nr:hypothetical protein BU17DRAFT_86676 [Hysterangium stoloniferum]